MKRAREIFDIVAKETDSILLFHSLSGKDSIAMLDLAYPKFKRIVCVYMYVVPNLRHIQNYYVYAKKKYPNVEFIQVPHYATFSYMKYGYMGSAANPKQRKWELEHIIDKVRERTGIEWTCIGFKQSDSLNRRLMLRTYKDGKEAINWKSKKFYPLSTYYNADVLDYISRKNLKKPESYGDIAQSAGTCITDYNYLKYLRENYPDDLKKICDKYPAIITILNNEE